MINALKLINFDYFNCYYIRRCYFSNSFLQYVFEVFTSWFVGTLIVLSYSQRALCNVQRGFIGWQPFIRSSGVHCTLFNTFTTQNTLFVRNLPPNYFYFIINYFFLACLLTCHLDRYITLFNVSVIIITFITIRKGIFAVILIHLLEVYGIILKEFNVYRTSLYSHYVVTTTTILSCKINSKIYILFTINKYDNYNKLAPCQWPL